MLQPHQDGTNRTTDISFKPFIDSYDFNSQQGLTRQISTRAFRTACIKAHISSIARSNWNFFWSLSLNLVHRNVIYRFLTHTIPTKRLLHYFEIAESPLCPICGNEENAVHLLFLCSSKASIWKAIIFEFLWPTVSIGDIIQACSSLDFENIKYVSKSYTTAHMVVLVTLGNIWRAQVRMIFHSTPFIWIDVVQQIKNELLQLHAQTEIHKQL
ncbi:condensin complex non-SMC subunit Cnd1 [Mucor velutinosus]|uniref:Condensin complex non-SMC subunit Cnd1 n=1 Tax=Mucor velutinosus TaxID=708070 RepID=A0AAN7HWR3_9FUNG|nr:condensin complex non-SMC subunit Cnd1 [Mucor velutinosus]